MVSQMIHCRLFVRLLQGERGIQNLLRNVLDHGVARNVDIRGNGLVQDFMELGDDTWSTQNPVENGTGSIGSSIGAGDELGKSLSSELLTAELLSVGVTALHQAGKKVNTGVVGHDLGLETLIDTGDRNTSQSLNSLETIREELIGNVLSERLQGRQTTQGGGHLATAVQNLDSGNVGRRSVRRLAHLGDILALLEHTERSAESQVTNDVESQVVEPVQGVDGGIAGLGVLLGIRDLVPLLGEQLDVGVNVLLELTDRLGREGVGDRLTLAGVLGTVTSIEQTATDGNEGVIEVPALG